MRRLFALGLALSFTSSLTAQTAPPIQLHDPVATTCPRSDRLCSDWLVFRRGVAGPYQAFAAAVSPGRATVIISEAVAPRSDLLELVDAAFGADLIRREYHRWSTGLDGWLEDLVLEIRIQGTRTAPVLSGHDLSTWEAPASIVERLAFIYAALHGTRAGFAVDRIAVIPARPAAIPEPKFSLTDLRGWVENPALEWSEAVAAAPPIPLAKLTAVRQPSTYVRADRSLVALVVPAKSTLASVAVPFRQFAVSSDLLLGAYHLTGGSTVLIGRVRQLPFTALPPLRFETLSSFVRYRTTELAQSYERQRIFAGKVQAGVFTGWDWAPILLSGQLEDSEFGTLLNLADQILKSWSQAGEVRYHAFAHPDPPRFPFGDLAASDLFEIELGTTSLVFNWNTEGFTTIAESARGEWLTVDRLGALPILYVPSGAPSGAAAPKQDEIDDLSRETADEARDFFARRGDPILVRVAQNTLLYQIAQAFLTGLAPLETNRPSRWDAVSQTLRDEARQWLTTVTNAKASDLSPADRASDAAVARLVSQSRLTIAQLAELIATPQVTASRLAAARARYEHARNAWLDLMPRAKQAADAYDKAFDQFCIAVSGTQRTVSERDPASGRMQQFIRCEYDKRKLALPLAVLAQEHLEETRRESTALDASSEALLKDVQQSKTDAERTFAMYEEAGSIARTLARQAGTMRRLDGVLERVRARANSTVSDGSIRTPAIVLSRNVEDEGVIGGHNINFNPIRTRVPGFTAAPPKPGARPPIPLPGNNPAAEATVADITTALGTRRTGTVLDESRAIHARRADAPTMTAVVRQAGECGCDLFVLRNPSGETFVVRHKPPPMTRQLDAPTDLSDLIAGPPKAEVVRFEGFGESRATVEGIAQTVQLMEESAMSRPGALRRFTEAAAGLFRSADGPMLETTWVSYTRPGRPRELLQIVGEIGDSLTVPVRQRAAVVATAPVGAGRGPGIVVRFPKGQGAPSIIDEVEVVVAGVGGSNARAISQQLVTATTAVQAKLPARLPLGDWLIEVRQAIKQRMTKAEITFFFKRNAKRIRVAERLEAGTIPAV